MPKRTVVKEGKNFKQYDDGTFRIMDVRASYAHVYEPKAGKDKDGNPTNPSFSITGLGAKKTHKEAVKALTDARDKLLSSGTDKQGKARRIKKENFFVKDGDDMGKDEYEDMYAISCREVPNKPPALRGEKGERLTKGDGVIYSGCYVDIWLRPWWQDNDFGKRVNANLLGVKFRRKGEPFGDVGLTDDDADELMRDDDDDDSGFANGDDDDL